MSRNASVPVRAAAGLILAIAAAIAFSTPAAAHSTIVESTPGAGEEIASAPERFSITANEDLADITGAGEGFALRIVAVTTGEEMTSGPLTIDGPTLSTPGVPLAGGAYVMQYQVVSADGHPVSGEIPFSVAGAQAPPTAGPGTLVEPPVEAPLWPVWLAVSVALALVVIGSIIAIRRRR